MQVTCHLFGPFRDAVGRKELDRDVDAGTTLGELLRGVEDDYADLDEKLTDGEAITGSVVVTVNGKHAKHLDGFDTELGDGDVVGVTPPVYGG